MPNWTYNHLEVSGEKKHLDYFLARVKGENDVIDFNAIIPMPEIIKNTGSGSKEFNGVMHHNWYANSTDKIERPLTAEELVELDKTGFRSWYDWACAKWGTKWNALGDELEDNSEWGELHIKFDTAWCPPEPIYDALIGQFPKLNFELRYRNEEDPEYPHCVGEE